MDLKSGERTITILNSTTIDAAYISTRLTDDDKRDVKIYNISAFESLCSSIKHDGICKTAFLDGEPFAMFGVRNVSLVGNSSGVVWQLGTDRKYEIPLSVIKLTRAFFEHCLFDLKYEHLFNWYAEYNKRTMKYLIMCGAVMYPELDIVGADGNKYSYFRIDKESFTERVGHV